MEYQKITKVKKIHNKIIQGQLQIRMIKKYLKKYLKKDIYISRRKTKKLIKIIDNLIFNIIV